MNDLAEKALQGLDVARREVIARPMLSFAVVGFAVSSVVVVAGARVGAARASRPLTSWFGLQDSHVAQAGDAVPGLVMLAGIAALVLVWLAVVELVRRSGQPESRVWWVAAAWAAPFALGPPLMDTTAYSYVAFGLLQRHGYSPYDSGVVTRLGDAKIVSAIDPGARGTPSGVGPVGTLVQHLSVSISAGNALGAVIVLRVVSVLVAVAIGRLAADLGGTRRSRALTLTVLNPLLLLYVVSAEHLDGLMIALALGAIAKANQRRWFAAVVLAGLAGSVSGQGFIVLPAVVAVHWLGRRAMPRWRLVGRDTIVAAGTVLVVGVAASDGFGWLWTVSKQFSLHTPFSISSATAKMLSAVVRGASYDDLADGARITALTALVCVAGYLIATARHRALERTVGYCLVAIALLAPVLYPWYLLWGALSLAPTANGSRRVVVLGLCAAGCVLSPPGFAPTTTNVVTAVALAVVAVVVAGVLRRRPRAPAASLPTGDLADGRADIGEVNAGHHGRDQ
jgi:alpha-1,6-mannosyltransferase